MAECKITYKVAGNGHPSNLKWDLSQRCCLWQRYHLQKPIMSEIDQSLPDLCCVQYVIVEWTRIQHSACGTKQVADVSVADIVSVA